MTELVTPPQTVDPTPNLPLLRKVLGHIDNHPREWNQSTWGMQTQSETACSTAHCVAGWAVVFDGTHDVTYSPHSGRMRIDGQQEILAHPVSGGHLRCSPSFTGATRSASPTAKRPDCSKATTNATTSSVSPKR